MTWDHPFWLFAVLSVPLIILLHLLARRRREIVVPSLHLWNRLLENSKPSLRFRRLIADLLLILQLISAILLAIALAGPRMAGGGDRITGPSVLAIDISAGMSATDEKGHSRLTEAIERAEELIKGKAGGVEMAILAGGTGVRPVSGFTRSRRQLLNALHNLEGSDKPGSPSDLIKAASALTTSRSGSRVIFISDAAFDTSIIIGIPVELVPVGISAENAGIVLFDIRNLPGGGQELLIAVENFGESFRNLNLTVNLDGRILMEEDFVLAAGERTVRNLIWQEELSGKLYCRLSNTLEDDPVLDALSLDDTVTAVLSPEDRLKAVLYTPGNWFLETLLASHPGLDLQVLKGSGEEATLTRPPEDADILILDRIAPSSTASYPMIAIYPFQALLPEIPLRPVSSVQGRDAVSWRTDHPVMQDVDLSRISISRSVLLDPVPGTSILAESTAGPLILSGEDGQRRWMALSFNILASSLPINSVFPILFSNTLEWIAPGRYDGTVVSGLLDAGESNLKRRWHGNVTPGDGEIQAWSEGEIPKAIPYSQPLTAILLLVTLVSILGEWILQTRLWRRQ